MKTKQEEKLTKLFGKKRKGLDWKEYYDRAGINPRPAINNK